MSPLIVVTEIQVCFVGLINFNSLSCEPEADIISGDVNTDSASTNILYSGDNSQENMNSGNQNEEKNCCVENSDVIAEEHNEETINSETTNEHNSGVIAEQHNEEPITSMVEKTVKVIQITRTIRRQEFN